MPKYKIKQRVYCEGNTYEAGKEYEMDKKTADALGDLAEPVKEKAKPKTK